VGVDTHDPGIGLYGGSCVVGGQAIFLIQDVSASVDKR
jgi:hypothetical protein